MASTDITPEQAKAALDAVNKHGSKTAAAASLGIPRTTLNSRLERIAANPSLLVKKTPTAIDIVPVEDQLRDRVKELESQIKTSRADTLDDEYVKRKIIGLASDVSNVEPPRWTIEMPRGRGLPGIPTAFASDWHWGETVFPTQINGINEFNLEIAHRRARGFFEKIVYLLRRHVVQPEYPGLVLALGGDMMSGDIHDELSESNGMPVMPCLLDLFGVLRWGIGSLADEFGHVFVPCVTGNHGRNTKKPRAKGRNFTNFDWLLYQFLARAFEGDDRVVFNIPDGPDALYEVAGHKYLLTHGDSFRGGDGLIGHFGPVLRGQKKKQARNSDIGLSFDTMIHGHFHTYFPTSKIIGNGSLKGLDEYAYQGNFGYEPPIQAMWLTHPEHGISVHLPIYLERAAGRAPDASSDWVSWHKH